MRRNGLWKWTQVVLLVGLFLIVQTHSSNAQSAKPSGTVWGRIVLIEPGNRKGTLKIQQARRVAAVNAVEGMLVRRGDLLILRPMARAMVICGDGKAHELAPGLQGCPCTQPCSPEVCGIRYKGSTIGTTRGTDSDQGFFPVVLTPRQTLLRNLRPTLRWTPLAGAKADTIYQVTLYGDNMTPLWSKDVAYATRLTYPDSAPALTPGQTYKVVVTSAGFSSLQEQTPGLGFTTLTAAQARRLDDEEKQRQRLPLPETQIRLLIANLYAARELYAEAIEQLEDLAANRREAEVIRTLGDVYATIGLNREAEKKYMEALTLTAADDLAGQGLTQSQLAQVYDKLGSVELAQARWRAAAKAYRRLGNRAKVKALLRKAHKLQRPLEGR
ncbi:MAG: tetratricopeptide repeat protein [Acidobacteria bacterium]|nr:tetratricopeptide repeat protein [Acidobacteriota bacterium]